MKKQNRKTDILFIRVTPEQSKFLKSLYENLHLDVSFSAMLRHFLMVQGSKMALNLKDSNDHL